MSLNNNCLGSTSGCGFNVHFQTLKLRQNWSQIH